MITMIGAWLLKRPLVVAALTAALVAAPAYMLGNINGSRTATAQAELRASKATIEQLKERGLINEAVRNTVDRDLCLELGGLPIDCNQ